MNAVEEAKEKGILSSSSALALPKAGQSPRSGAIFDDKGEMVVTKLNEQMGQDSSHGGLYIRANGCLYHHPTMKDNLEKLEQSELETTMYSSYDEVFLLLSSWHCSSDSWLLRVPDRKNRYLRDIGLFETKVKKW